MSDHLEHTGNSSMTYLYIALAIVALTIVTIIHAALA
jgi:hypothetical protein